MIQPALQSAAFLANVAAAGRSPEQLHLWWLGQSGFLVQWQGRHLLFDPYLSDSLTRKYAQTDKPHVRMTELVIAPERLDFVEVVTSSHNHTDHLDAETLKPLAQANPGLVMVCPEANRTTVRERSGLPDERIVGLTTAAPSPRSEARGEGRGEGLPLALPTGEATTSFPRPSPLLRVEEREKMGAVGIRLGALNAVQIGPWEIHALPAAHEALDTDKDGRPIYLGFVVRVGPWTLYHSGDTILFPGMAELLKPFRVDVALLPINGRAPERRVAGNLWGREAAQLAAAIGARCVIPCHYEMFEFNTASPAEFVETSHLLNQPCAVLRAGERWSLAAGSRG
jgi:L-ascorbate metabolism protein UlaG (beta-lactamase superfamily)